MRIRITQLDGKLPNLALMRLSSWHKAKGDEVYFTRRAGRSLLDPEPTYDRVYASAIFEFSAKKTDVLRHAWPDAIVGGTGSGNKTEIETMIGDWSRLDYSIYPEFKDSIGFTQRGCRLKCKFCVVPLKEGKPRHNSAIYDIWRGDDHPKKLHLLDNDFFGGPQWKQNIEDIREGGFRVCLSQGINTRLINQEAAEALATIEYRDTKFSRRRLYTAWDSIGDEAIFFRGVDTLERAGIPPTDLMAYMLIGYDKREDWARIWHRFHRMVDCGIKPYPMVFDRTRADLKCFQRWVCMGLYRNIPWPDYRRKTKSEESVIAYQNDRKAA